MQPAARLPETRPVAPPIAARPFDAEDPRALHLMQGLIPPGFAKVQHEVPQVHLIGVPFDGAVIGRKGCAEGPAAIREAFRYFTTYDMVSETDLAGLTVVDQGDVVVDADTRTTHARAADAVGASLAQGAVPFVLGGDNSLTFAHLQGLAEAVDGRIGIVVIDAHYDLRRPKDGEISSGTPFYRILTELNDETGTARVAGRDIVEIGIRPFANSAYHAKVAEEFGVHVYTDSDLRHLGMAKIIRETLGILEDVDHLWLSIDIDGVDQAYAPGSSAPTPNGLTPQDLYDVCRAVASEERFRGMDLLETAPNLDPSGNTARVAARAVMETMLGHVRRR